jgi:SAM-dependent methyltransferase
MSEQNQDYVLGTHDEELNRLGFQHSLWREHAAAAWQHAGFKSGHAILDVGCGPGFGTADLSQFVGPTGRVVGVDLSDKFVTRVRSLGLGNVTAQVCDVQSLATTLRDSISTFDGVYARWVLCFVPDPQQVIDGVARLLKPGGRFVIQDYYNYRAIKVAPRSEAFERVIRAVDESWRIRGGDPDIGCRLPAMLARAGLRVTHLEPIVRIARPSEPLWQWPTTFFKIFIPSLVEMGLLTSDDEQAYHRDWAERAADPNAYFSTPPMVELAAQKA